MPVSGAVAGFGGVEEAAGAHGVPKVALLALVARLVAAVLIHQVVRRTGFMSRMGRA